MAERIFSIKIIENSENNSESLKIEVEEVEIEELHRWADDGGRHVDREAA